MNKKQPLKTVAFFTLFSTLVGVSINTHINNGDVVAASAATSRINADNYAITSPSDYYSGISDVETGTTLRAKIYNLMIATHKLTTTYDELKQVFTITDANPNKSGQVELFYTGEYRDYSESFSGTINREHVWPNSRGVGEAGPGADAQHLRPCDVTVNSKRANLRYGQGGYIPTDAYKGVAARIIFYIGAHYGPDSTYKLVLNEDNYTGQGTTFSSLSTLLEWNLLYPVNASEVRRNNAAQGIQGNRNPFIDNPSYACRIWGDTSDKTRAACATEAATVDEDVENVKSLIAGIGTVSFSAEENIIAAEAAYALLDATQKSQVTNYSVLQAAREKLDSLKSLETDVLNVITLIDNIGTVTLTSRGKINAATEAYQALSTAKQAQVFNYAILLAATEEYNDLIDVQSSSGISINFYDSSTLSATSGKDLTLAELQNRVDGATGTSTITSFSNNSTTVQYGKNGGLTLGSSSKTGSVTIGVNPGFSPYNLKLYAAKYDSGTFTVNSASASSGTIANKGTTLDQVTNPLTWNSLTASTLTIATSAGRATIYKIEIENPNPAVASDVALLNKLIEALKESEDVLDIASDIEYAEELYASLSASEKLEITDYATLVQLRSELDRINLFDQEVDRITDLIATIGTVSVSSKNNIIAAETAYANASEEIKRAIPNHEQLVEARATYDQLKANFVINLINSIGNVTLSSQSLINEANEAYNALENANQKALVLNYSKIAEASLAYENLLNNHDYTLDFSNSNWDSTELGAHIINDENMKYDMSCGKLENGVTYLGADESNNDKLLFKEESDFAGLESALQNSHNYYVGIKMLNIAISKPTEVIFSWSSTTASFELALVVSYDEGATWSTLSTLNNVTGSGSISWNSNASKGLKNANSNSHAQYALIAGSDTAGYIVDLAVVANYEGRLVDTESNLDALISIIESANTCIDYINIVEYKALYEELSEQEKITFKNTIGSDDVNVKDKLDYMETLYNQSIAEASDAASLTSINKYEVTFLIFVSIFAGAIGYYYVTQKKKLKLN